MKDLEGRVAVVAGATRGAGRSTTKFFSGNGVSVAAMCAESRPLNVASLLSRTVQLAAGGAVSKGLQVDLTIEPVVSRGRAFDPPSYFGTHLET